MSPEGFEKVLKRAALEFLKIDRNKTIRIVSHLDCDGLCSAAILIRLLELMERRYAVIVVNQLERDFLRRTAKEDYTVFIFSDMGSSLIQDIASNLRGKKVFVLDHHVPSDSSCIEEIVHVNPHEAGLDGNEISGAGVSYLFAKAVNNGISSMAEYGIIGAIGDVQEQDEFFGLNKEILKDAVTNGRIEIRKWLKFVPYSKKKLRTALKESYEISSRAGDNIDSVLAGNGINGDKPIIELSDKETERIAEELAQIMNLRREELLRNYYWLSSSRFEGLREAREFSTVLNACGRIGKPSIGIGACLGDDEMKKRALGCLTEYRGQIQRAFEWFRANRNTGNVTEGKNYIIVNAKDKVLGTIIGTFASMLSKSNDVKQGFIMSLARLEGGKTKVSLRVRGRKDVNLREIMEEIMEGIQNVEFGGHKYAAGALIRTESEREFIEKAKGILGKKGMEEVVS